MVSKKQIREHVTQPMGESKILKITIEHNFPTKPYNDGLFAKVDTRTYISIAYPKDMSKNSFIANIKAHIGLNAHTKATPYSLLVDFPSWLIALKENGSEWKFVDKEYIAYLPKDKVTSQRSISDA